VSVDRRHVRGPCHASPSSPLDVTSALYALPCRIAGQADSGANPTKHHVTAGLASPCISREASCRLSSSKREVNSAPFAWLECCTSRPLGGNQWFRRFPDLLRKFAVTGRRFPDISKKFPVHERREFVAKSLIVRTEVRARFAEQAIFGENSL
jgi:hypothetical protein